MKLKKTTFQDIPNLSKLCKEAYSHYFGDHWTSNGLDLYLENQFSHSRLKNDLSETNLAYYFVMMDEVLTGFLKVKFNVSNDWFSESSCELEKIYILPHYKNQGLGAFAIQGLKQKAQALQQTILYLHVLDSNQEAIKFYEKLGFQSQGTHRLNVPHFKEELRGMQRLYIKL